MSDDLITRLQMVSNMINMGERISWGQETTLMDEAAAELTRLRAKVDAADKLARAVAIEAGKAGMDHAVLAALSAYEGSKE